MSDFTKWVERLMAAGCMPKVAAEVVADVFVAGVRASPLAPVAPNGQVPTAYADSTCELWGEGPALLAQLGQPARSSRSNIGRWLKNSRPDAILSAIRDAHRARAGDPVPYVTMALGGKHGRKHVADAFDDLIARAERREVEAGAERGNVIDLRAEGR